MNYGRMKTEEVHSETTFNVRMLFAEVDFAF